MYTPLKNCNFEHPKNPIDIDVPRSRCESRTTSHSEGSASPTARPVAGALSVAVQRPRAGTWDFSHSNGENHDK